MRISDPHNCKFNYLDPHNRKFDYPDPQNGKFDYPDPHNCKFDYSDHHNCKVNYPDQRRCGIGFGLICNIAKSMIRSFVVKSLDPIQFHFFSWIFMYQVLSKIFVCELIAVKMDPALWISEEKWQLGFESKCLGYAKPVLMIN